jgi:hypothetical protein
MQLLLDCLNCRRGLEHGETGIDMFVLPGIGLLCGEGTAVENPVKSLALSPISLRGVIIFRDGNSLLDIASLTSAGEDNAFLNALDFAALTAG